MAARIGVEGRDAHQPVHAQLRLEPAEGVVAADDEAGALDARLLPRLEVARLHLPAFALRIAGVHPVEHLRPVLRLGAARAGVDLDDGVEPVLRPGEHAGKLQPRRALVRLGQGGLRLAAGDLVVGLFRQLVERHRVVELLALALELGELQLQIALLLAQGLGALLVVPEARLHALPLDQLDARALLLDVKAPPGALRSARRARPVPVARSPWRTLYREIADGGNRLLRQRVSHQAEGAQEPALGPRHPPRLPRRAVIVAAAVQQAVRQQAPQLDRERPPSLARLAAGRGQRDDHVAQRPALG